MFSNVDWKFVNELLINKIIFKLEEVKVEKSNVVDDLWKLKVFFSIFLKDDREILLLDFINKRFIIVSDV